MLPSDGRFGAGPSRIRAEQMQALCSATEMGTSHRKVPVKDRVASLKAGLRDLFSLPPSYEIVFGLGGATTFWAVAATSLVENRAEAAVFGEFGAKFAADISRAPWAEVEVVEAPPGELAIIQEPGEGVDTYAYTENETSTGVVSPIYRPAPSPALTLVDATSIAGASVVDWESVDAYYFSPQKCFGSEGGLWVAILSPAAVERARELEHATDRFMPAALNLAAAIKQSAADQTVNTPALATLILFDEQVKWMLANGGMPEMVRRSQAGATLVQEWAESRSFAAPFVKVPKWRSTVTTTVSFEGDVPILQIAKELREVGIVDIEGYRKIGGNQLRIATFPSTPPSDVAALLDCLDWMVERA